MMVGLLGANFSQLKKNGIFRIAIVAAVFVGVFCPVWYHRLLVIMEAPQGSYSLDYYLFPFINAIAFIVTAFCSFFMSVDQDNGTLRNKIIVGHRRSSVYFANLVTNISVACILYSIYMVLVLAIGIPYIGKFQLFTRTEIFLFVCCAYAVMFALAAMVTLITMLSSNMVISLGASICVVVGSMCWGVHQLNLLTDVAFWTDQMTKRREMTLFFLDFLPGSQIMEFFAMKENLGNMNAGIMLGGSAFFFAVFTMTGLILFQKRSLK